MTAAVVQPVRDVRIEGVATLLSSLAHGGDHSGTVSYLRREKIMTPTGPTEIPVVSGNSLRGILRDHAADLFWQHLGRPELPAPVFHLLWSGGSLAKAGANHALSSRQLAKVRAMVPVVSVFGGSGAGRIIEGKLRVGKLTPICTETAHLLPPDLADTATSSVWDALQIEEFTRCDDAKRDQLAPAIEGASIPAIESGQAVLLDLDDEPVEKPETPAQQMRYGVETMAAGSRLHWWMSLHGITDVEAAMIAGAIDAWTDSGAHIGGRSATGHGRLRLDVHQWATATPSTTVGAALAVAGSDDLAEHVRANQDGIWEALGWFA